MLTIQSYYHKTDLGFNPCFLIYIFHLILILTRHILFHHIPVPTYIRNNTPFTTYIIVATHINMNAKLKYISTYPPNMETVSVSRPPVRKDKKTIIKFYQFGPNKYTLKRYQLFLRSLVNIITWRPFFACKQILKERLIRWQNLI